MANQKSDPTPGWGKAFPTIAATAGAALSYSTFDANSANIGKSQHAMNTAPSTTIQHHVDERLLNAKLDAVEARTETKFAQLLGEMKTLGVNVGHINTTLFELKTDVAAAKTAAAGTKTYVIGTGIAIAGFVLAIFAFGVQVLDIATALFSAGGAK